MNSRPVLCMVVLLVFIAACGMPTSNNQTRISNRADVNRRAVVGTPRIPANLSTHFFALNGMYNVYFINRYQGWATLYNSRSAIIHTADGGKHWSAEPTPMGSSHYNRTWYGIYFTNKSQGWAVGTNYYNPGSTLGDATLGGQNVYRDGYIVATRNGGLYWQQQRVVRHKILFGVSCVNSNECWAVGQDGTVIATKDGGNHWRRQNTGVVSTLYNVQFINPEDGWAVGEDETIIATEDGGHTWKVEWSGLKQDVRYASAIYTESLYSVYFINKKDGWAVGGGGLIMHTSNGGTTWVTQRKPRIGGVEYLHSVRFINTQKGWAVGGQGFGGLVVVTYDGGMKWTKDRQMENMAGASHEIFFDGRSDGWITSASGDLVFTTNGGAIWKRYAYKSGRMFCGGVWVLCAEK